MPFINYVELNVPEASKSAIFYQSVFGWNLQAWGDKDYLVAQHGEEPGIDSALRTAPDGQPLTVAVVAVDDIGKTIERRAGASWWRRSTSKGWVTPHASKTPTA